MPPNMLFLVLILFGSACVLSAAVNENAVFLVEKQQQDEELQTILFDGAPKIHECLTTNATFKRKLNVFDTEALWTVVILKEEIFENKTLHIQQCSGSLIHAQVVLTAAHCIFKKSLTGLKVRAGECNRIHDSNIYRQESEIESFELLKTYDASKPKQDIALLFLKDPFKITTHVKTACLPPADVQLDLDYVRCFATGWGRKPHILPGYANFKKLNMTVIPNENCENVLQLTGLGEDFTLHKSFMCARGDFDKAVLDANGGAPLVCPLCGANGRMIQVGLMSWGFSNALLPDVFTSIRSARYWISKKLQEKRLHLSGCGITWKNKKEVLMRQGLVIPTS